MKKLFITIPLLFILCARVFGQNLHDLDAKEYIFKANITIPEEKIAISKLFRALKYYGIWDDIHALYLPCGGTELSHSLNAKDPRMAENAFPLIFPNGATHKHSGISWNGIDQGARSSYRPTTDRLHLMVYHRTPAHQPAIFTGDRNGITDYNGYLWSALYSNGYIGFSNTNGIDLTAEEERTGFFYGQRISHETTEGYVNGIKKATWQRNSNSYYNTDTSRYIWLNKSNQFAQFRDTTEYQLVSIGNVMPQQKVENYYNIIQAFLSELHLQSGNMEPWPIVPESYQTIATINHNWIKATSQAVDTAIDGVHLYSLNDSLYLWGGWNGNWFPFSFNTGHVSGDGGYTWTPLGAAPWNIRHSASAGTDDFGNAYLIGSDMMAAATQSDRKEVWRTVNGRDWELRTASAPWSGNLILQGLAIKDDSLFVGGGQFGYNVHAGMNDTIWRSVDGGMSWTAINTNAPHLGGILYNNFKYFKARKKFVAFAGGKYHNTADLRVYSNQVWVSDDCITWTREDDVPFEARQYSDMVEWDGKLWVFAGDRESINGAGWLNLKDLWYMDADGNWHEEGSLPLPERHASGLTIDRKNDRMVIACGNMHQDVWLFEKLKEGPAFNAPLIKEVYTSHCNYTVPNLASFVTSSQPNTVFSQFPIAGTIVPVANNDLMEVRITGTNASGSRTQSVTLVIRDTTAPAYNFTDTVTRYLSNTCKISVPNLLPNFIPQDNCPGNTLVQSIASGTVLSAQHNQIIPIQLTATDLIGNSKIYTVYLKVKDSIKPSFTCPPSRNIQLGSGCKMVIPDLISGITATDNCSAVTLTQSPVAGTNIPTLPNSFHLVVLTAKDEAGNITTCTVTLTAIDTTSPGFGLVTNRQFFADAGECYSSAAVTTPTVADQCNVTVIKQRSDGMPPGSVFSVGETIIMWIAEDLAGNTSIAEQKVIVIDNQAPMIEAYGNLTFCARQNNVYTIPSLVSNDNCGIASVNYTITGATNRSGSGHNASGNFNPGINHINWKVTDINGNETTKQATITINHPLTAQITDVFATTAGSQPNTIYIGYGPAAITLQLQVAGGLAPYTYSWTNGSTQDHITVAPAVAGTHPYSVTVKDALGCQVTAQVFVKVIDVRCENGKVLVCKDEPVTQTTSCVPIQEVENLLNNGYLLGPCNTPSSQDSMMYFSARVKPNPSPNYFTLSIHHIYDEPLVIRIFDMRGRLLETMKLYTKQIEISLGQNYPAGVYIAEVICGRYRKQIKMMKTGG